MKIALMTWFQYDSYGTVLQAAALSHVLRTYGHEVDVIDYAPGSGALILPEKGLKNRLADRFRTGMRQPADPVITTRISSDAFDAFRDAMLSRTHTCETLTDLERLNEEYDAFVCGSDLIWMPMHFDPHLFLDFVKDPARMIAYAPSILDTGKVDDYVMQQMQELIGRFSHLSVREDNGRRYLRDAFGEQTLELADPVLLVDADDWGSHLALPGENSQPYLLIMLQGGHRAYFDAAHKLSTRLGLSPCIVPIHESDLNKSGALQEAVGPIDLISLIRNADFICTDSYHATLIALIFQKNFCCFERFTRRDQLPLNARVTHILDAVGLSSRLYSPDAPLERYIEDIDYIPVNYKLDALKIKSREFLSHSLLAVQAHSSLQVPVRHHILQGFSLCSGCGACAAACQNHAIVIGKNESGELRALVNEDLCSRCEACRAVCPFQGEPAASAVASGQLLSYLDEEEQIQQNASGGGFNTRLAMVLKNAGYACTVCIRDESSGDIRHVLVTPDADDELLRLGGGSRYAQSLFGEVLKELEAYEGKAAIFALPCQIAGARKFFEAKGREDIVFIELRCGGICPPLLEEKAASEQEKRYSFLTGRDNVQRVRESNVYLCRICYECRWRDRTAADLRVGDYTAEGERQSSVIAVNDKGWQMLHLLMIAGYWEELHKKDMISYVTSRPDRNPPVPVFYREICEQFKDEKVSIGRIINEYVKPFEKQ